MCLRETCERINDYMIETTNFKKWIKYKMLLFRYICKYILWEKKDKIFMRTEKLVKNAIYFKELLNQFQYS